MHKIDISVIILVLSIVMIMMVLKLTANMRNNKIKDLLNEKKTSEGFIVADAQDFTNYNKSKEEIKNDVSVNDIPIKDIPKVNIPKPDENDDEFSIGIVYGKPKKIPDIKEQKKVITANEFGWEGPPFPIVSCANSSIDSRYKTGPKRIKPYSIACGYPNTMTAESYYKTHYMAEVANLEDYRVRGANYMDYTDFIHPTKSNIRILSQNTKGLPPEDTEYRNIPTGSNYAFHNTPSQRLP